MTSVLQQKHHARFHAAVLRTLFQESSSSSSQASPSALVSSLPEPDIPTLIQEEDSHVVDDHLGVIRTEHLAWQPLNSQDAENVKCPLSRAQRKRLKVKKLKETQSQAVKPEVSDRARRFIGPLLPELESSFQKEPSGDCIPTDIIQQKSKIGKDSLVLDAEDPTDTVQQENENRDAKEQQDVTCNGDLGLLEDSGSLNRVKKRRLAKRLLGKLPRDSSGSVFTAEVVGADVVIKKIT